MITIQKICFGFLCCDKISIFFWLKRKITGLIDQLDQLKISIVLLMELFRQYTVVELFKSRLLLVQVI